MTLTEFLLARIAEDEALALRVTPGRQAKNGRWNRGSIQDQAVRAIDPLHADHVLRHDPARVLAECEAKRRIVADRDEDHGADNDEWSMGYTEANYAAMGAIALVYADHPDYQPEWKP